MTTENQEKKKYTLVGRPTLYDPALPERVMDYLNHCEDKGEFRNIRINLPKVEGLALYIGVSKDTLYEWAKRYPEFSDALKMVKNEQYCRLIDEGLAGRYNATIAKLILSSNHNLTEVSKNINQISGRLEVSPEQREQANKAILAYLARRKQG